MIAIVWIWESCNKRPFLFFHVIVILIAEREQEMNVDKNWREQDQEMTQVEPELPLELVLTAKTPAKLNNFSKSAREFKAVCWKGLCCCYAFLMKCLKGCVSARPLFLLHCQERLSLSLPFIVLLSSMFLKQLPSQESQSRLKFSRLFDSTCEKHS